MTKHAVGMNTYKVTFAPRHDIDNIQRTTTLAESPEEVRSIFGDCHVQEVEEMHAVEQATALEIPEPDADMIEFASHFGELPAAEFCSGAEPQETVSEFSQADDDERQDTYLLGMGG